MKIRIPENLNPMDAIRKCGYGLVNDPRADQISFSRRLGQGFYPRFHAYIEGHMVNLHLDQKQASYEGYHAHSGEYDGETVEGEGARISDILERLSQELSGELMEELDEEEKKEDSKGFWGRLFK